MLQILGWVEQHAAVHDLLLMSLISQRVLIDDSKL